MENEIKIISSIFNQRVLFMRDNKLFVRETNESLEEENVYTITETEIENVYKHDNHYEITFINPQWKVMLQHILIKKTELNEVFEKALNNKIEK